MSVFRTFEADSIRADTGGAFLWIGGNEEYAVKGNHRATVY